MSTTLPSSCRPTSGHGSMTHKTDRTTRPSPAIDPVTAEIVRSALASAADQMALALYRTAYSTVVRDTLDFSTSLCDPDGQMIAQSVTIPLHMGSVMYAMETLFKKFGD